MTTVLAEILLAAGATWVLRVLFIGVVPAHRLPERSRGLLQLVGPAALAALVATDMRHASTSMSAFLPTLIAVGTAAIVIHLSRNLGVAIVAGFGAALLVALVG